MSENKKQRGFGRGRPVRRSGSRSTAQSSTTNRSVEERKRTSRCAACGQIGHWKGDKQCPETDKTSETPSRSPEKTGPKTKGGGKFTKSEGGGNKTIHWVDVLQHSESPSTHDVRIHDVHMVTSSGEVVPTTGATEGEACEERQPGTQTTEATATAEAEEPTAKGEAVPDRPAAAESARQQQEALHLK